MAKLNARGRKCLVECTREYDETILQRQHDKHWNDGQPSLTIWERSIRRLMSDNTILEKRDVRFRPSPSCTWEDQRGVRHSYGWKVRGKLKTGLTAEDFARIYGEPRKDGSPSRWTINRQVAGLRQPIIISQARIVRAIESGEYIGFCTSCGNDQSGVEPDANGYRCDSCGDMAVCGAEDLLAGLA